MWYTRDGGASFTDIIADLSTSCYGTAGPNESLRPPSRASNPVFIDKLWPEDVDIGPAPDVLVVGTATGVYFTVVDTNGSKIVKTNQYVHIIQ